MLDRGERVDHRDRRPRSAHASSSSCESVADRERVEVAREHVRRVAAATRRARAASRRGVSVTQPPPSCDDRDARTRCACASRAGRRSRPSVLPGQARRAVDLQLDRRGRGSPRPRRATRSAIRSRSRPASETGSGVVTTSAPSPLRPRRRRRRARSPGSAAPRTCRRAPRRRPARGRRGTARPRATSASAASVARSSGSAQAAASRSRSNSSPRDEHRERAERARDVGARGEDRRLVLLQVAVVGERQPLDRREQPGEPADRRARLAARELGDVGVQLLRHHRRARSRRPRAAARSRTRSSSRARAPRRSARGA